MIPSRNSLDWPYSSGAMSMFGNSSAPSSAPKPKGATPATEKGGGPHGKAGMADWIVDLIKALEAIPASVHGSDGQKI